MWKFKKIGEQLTMKDDNKTFVMLWTKNNKMITYFVGMFSTNIFLSSYNISKYQVNLIMIHTDL